MTVLSVDVRPYHESALFYEGNPYGGGSLMKAQGAMCADGKRRTAWPTPRGEMTGQPDTYFSIPCYVIVHEGRSYRVYGYVTTDYIDGGYEGNITVFFRAYRYRKHWMKVEPVHGPPLPYIVDEEDYDMSRRDV